MEENSKSLIARLKFLEKIIAKAPGNLYWKDKDGVYLGCNDSQAKLLGFSSGKEIVGKTDYQLPWKNEASTLRSNDIEVMKKKGAIVKEEPVTLPDGTIAIFYSKKEPLLDEADNVIGILGTSLNITSLKQAEEREKQALAEVTKAKAKAQAQEEIQRAILTFTGTLSHDLRTPLSTILMVTGLLAKGLPILARNYQETVKAEEALDENYEAEIKPRQLKTLMESCQTISEVVKQADTYIDATLKIIKGAASGTELLSKEDLVLCSIEEIIRRVVRTFPYQAGEEEKIHIDTMNSFSFMGNSIFMARIMQNLIKNAFEQIRQKAKGEIFIWCEQGEEKNSLYVKDTAGGVTPSVITHLFEGFNSSKEGGTGIGLSSAKKIMQAFGGNITCQLTDGDCIEFVILFPIVKNQSN